MQTCKYWEKNQEIFVAQLSAIPLIVACLPYPLVEQVGAYID